MKKIVFKFTNIFLSVLLFLSFMVSPASVSAFSGDYIQEFDSLPTSKKVGFFKNDNFIYKNCLVVMNLSGSYTFYFYDLIDSNNDIAYFDARGDSTRLKFCNSDGSAVDNVQYGTVFFRSDGSFSEAYAVDRTAYFINYLGVYYFNGSIDSFVDHIIYSDIPIKYGDNTIYSVDMNSPISIKDFKSWKFNNGSTSSSDDEFSSNIYYGDLRDFVQWLIDNNYYQELGRYGLSVGLGNLASIVDIWGKYGYSPQTFWELLKNQGQNNINNVNGVIGWFQDKYNEYILYHNSYVFPQPLPDNFNNSLVDSQSDDTLNVSLLREILKVLRNLPKNIYSYFVNAMNNINNKMSELLNDLKYTPNRIYNNFVDFMNNIQNYFEEIISLLRQKTDNNNNLLNEINTAFQSKFHYILVFDDCIDIIKNRFNSSVISSPIIKLPAFDNNYIHSDEIIIDFSFLVSYRSALRGFIVLITWLGIVIKNYRRLPEIIGGV